MKKKISWFEILIAILLLALIGLLTYNVMLAKQQNKEAKPEEQTKQEAKKKEKEEDKGIELETTDHLVTNLIKPFNVFNNPFHNSYFGYIYNTKEIAIDTLSNDIKLFLAIHTLNENNGKGYETLSADQVDTAVKKLFGNISYSHSTLKGNSCKYSYTYNDSTKTYNRMADGCGGTVMPFYENKIISATKYSDRIEITLLAGYFAYNTSSATAPILELYTNDDEKVKIASDIKEDSTTEFKYNKTLDTYKDQLYKYKFTFNLEDGNYYFKKIERQK